jgi:4-amino-4-deoxy-L-arabinose transferase-like glycosyltransferase
MSDRTAVAPSHASAAPSVTALTRRIATYYDAHPRMLDLTLIALVTASAAVLRLALLGRIPYGVHSDEAQLGTDGYKILDGDLWTVYTHAVLGQPSGHAYLTLPSFELLGWTPLAMRLPLALVALAAVPLLYVLVRITLGRIEAFFASAMLAVSYWHLFYSRVAHWSISYGTVLLGVFVCLFMGMNTRRRGWFLASGIVLGIGFYTYNIYPIAVVAFTASVIAITFMRYRRELRWWLRSLAITYVAAFVVALPMIIYVANPDSFYWFHINNYGDVRVTQEQEYKDASAWGKVEVIGDQVRDFAAAYAWDAPLDIVDGNGQRPMFDPPTVILLLAGLVIAFQRRREPMVVAAVCCFVIIPLPAVPQEGSIMRQPMAAAPYAMLLAALPLASLWRWGVGLGASSPRDADEGERRRTSDDGRADNPSSIVHHPSSATSRSNRLSAPHAVALAIPAILLAAITFTTVHDYFWTLRKDDWIRLIYFSQMTTASDYMRELPPDTYVLFYSERASINLETRQFLAPDVQGADRSSEFNPGDTSTDIPDRSRPTAFVLLDKYLPLLPDIERRYPGGTERKILRDGKIEFYAYEVPARE